MAKEPHCTIFRQKYRVIDDLVHYALKDHELEELCPNVRVYPSGFTVSVGKLVKKLLADYRNNQIFQQKMSKTVDECKMLIDNPMARQGVIERAVQFVPLLEANDLFHYFVYFAVTCELCARFTAEGLDDFVFEVKDSAKATLYVYWENSIRCEELDAYAKELLSRRGGNKPRNFCDPEYFNFLKFLLRR